MCGSTDLSPDADLPGRALLLLTRLHRLRLGRVAETVVQSVLSELTPRLPVLVALSTRHQALPKDTKRHEWLRQTTVK